MNAPCLGCGERHIGCHSECGRYKEYTEWNAAHRKKITDQKTAQRTISEVKTEGMKRMQRRHYE